MKSRKSVRLGRALGCCHSFENSPRQFWHPWPQIYRRDGQTVERIQIEHRGLRGHALQKVQKIY
jgi:hypothetical protein